MKTSKWTSRKFWMSVSAQAAALAVLFFPGHEDQVLAAAQSITALVLMTLTALGYVAAESSVDRKDGVK